MGSRGSRGLVALALAVAAMAALPAAASAVDRYASPAGVGLAPCAVGDPCPLEPAVEGASDGDQVILVGGAPPGPPFVHTAMSPIVLPVGVDVRGATGAHQVVNFGPAVALNDGFLLGATSTLRDLDILYEGNSSAVNFSSSGGSMERVFVRSVGAEANAPCFITGPATIRDSVCWYDTDSIQGAGAELYLQTGDITVNIVNSTIVSGSAQPGLLATTTFGGGATVNVTNSIVRSETGNDVRGQDAGSTADVTIVLDHSNFATEGEFDPDGQIEITNPGTPTNQIAPPVFVNAAAGNFRQTASSAGTLNLGSPAALLPGELDLNGLARNQEAAPDIGAHEFTPPPPPGNGGPGTTKKCKKKKAKKRSAAGAKKKCKKKKKKKRK